jgi:hypothetical protein
VSEDEDNTNKRNAVSIINRRAIAHLIGWSEGLACAGCEFDGLCARRRTVLMEVVWIVSSALVGCWFVFRAGCRGSL